MAPSSPVPSSVAVAGLTCCTLTIWIISQGSHSHGKGTPALPWNEASLLLQQPFMPALHARWSMSIATKGPILELLSVSLAIVLWQSGEV